MSGSPNRTHAPQQMASLFDAKHARKLLPKSASWIGEMENGLAVIPVIW